MVGKRCILNIFNFGYVHAGTVRPVVFWPGKMRIRLTRGFKLRFSEAASMVLRNVSACLSA